MGEIVKAEAAFPRVAAAAPESVEALVAKGEEQLARGRWKDAISFFADATSIRPESNAAHEPWHDAISQAPYQDPEIEPYRARLNECVDDGRMHLLLSRLYSRLSRPAETCR